MQTIKTILPPKRRLLKVQVEIGNILWKKKATKETHRRLLELLEEEEKLLREENEPDTKKQTQSPKQTD